MKNLKILTINNGQQWLKNDIRWDFQLMENFLNVS